MGPDALPGEAEALEARLDDLRAVGGEALVQRTVSRFVQHLSDALAAGPPVWTTAFAHRTAGVAAMLGLTRLADACRDLEDAGEPDPGATRDVIAASHSALDLINTRSPGFDH